MVRWWMGAVTLALATVSALPAHAADVVVNTAQRDSSVSRSLLRGMFGMRVRAWPDGTPVRVFVLSDNDPLHEAFTKMVLHMYPYQLRQNWDRLVYSGTGQPPITVSSEAEMRRRVAATPGAIGYLQRPGAESPKVKVLHVH